MSAHRKWAAADLERIATMRRDAFSLPEIAFEFSVDMNCIWRVCKRFNIVQPEAARLDLQSRKGRISTANAKKFVKAQRRCLGTGCGRMFESKSIGNRRCSDCARTALQYDTPYAL